MWKTHCIGIYVSIWEWYLHCMWNLCKKHIGPHTFPDKSSTGHMLNPFTFSIWVPCGQPVRGPYKTNISPIFTCYVGSTQLHSKVCDQPLETNAVTLSGHVGVFRLQCAKDHRISWHSSPYLGDKYLVNSRMAHGYFISGILPNQYESVPPHIASEYGTDTGPVQFVFMIDNMKNCLH